MTSATSSTVRNRTRPDCSLMSALSRARARGTVAAICSDHQPHEPDAKYAPFPATAPGISALETLLPLALRLADEGVMGLPEVLARLTAGPARVLGIEAGTLSVGARADVCIFDPQRHWRLEERTLVSRGHNTPFLGWEFKGQVMYTLLEGKVVYENVGRAMPAA